MCLAWSGMFGNYHLYVNSSLIQEGPLQSYHKIPGSGSLIIGGRHASAAQGPLENRFAGTISCLQIYNRKLAIEKITSLFNAKKFRNTYESFFNWNEVMDGKTVGNVSYKTPSSISKVTAGRILWVLLQYGCQSFIVWLYLTKRNPKLKIMSKLIRTCAILKIACVL